MSTQLADPLFRNTDYTPSYSNLQIEYFQFWCILKSCFCHRPSNLKTQIPMSKSLLYCFPTSHFLRMITTGVFWPPRGLAVKMCSAKPWSSSEYFQEFQKRSSFIMKLDNGIGLYIFLPRFKQNQGLVYIHCKSLLKKTFLLMNLNFLFFFF